MFKRFASSLLAGFLLASAFSVFAADGPQFLNVTGTGSRRNTTEWVIVPASTSDGTAADLRPGTDNLNSLGTSSYRIKDIQALTGTFGGALTQSGNFTLGSSAEFITTPAASVQSVNFGTSTIIPSSRFVLIGSTNSMNMNAANGPVISTITAVDGQWLTLLTTGTTLGIPCDVTLNTAMVFSSTRGAFVSISSVTPRTFLFKSGTGWLQQ